MTRTAQRATTQTLRRRSGDVKRVEVVLTADSARDQYIAAHLNALAFGTLSEWTRQALEEKIAREVSPPMDREDDRIAALLDEIAALRDQVSDLQRRPVTVAQTIMPIPADDPAQVASSGIDMGRPRKKLARGVVQETIHNANELTPEQEYTMRMQLVNSIRHCTIGGVSHDPR